MDQSRDLSCDGYVWAGSFFYPRMFSPPKHTQSNTSLSRPVSIMAKTGSKKYDVKKLYAKGLKLLAANPEICFESILFDCMGVSRDWFYKNIMSVKAYSDTIKDKLSANRGSGTLDCIRAMNASDSASCIIARANILNPDLRKRLSGREEIDEGEDEIPKITFGEQE